MTIKPLGIGVIGTGDVALKLYLPVISEVDPSRAWLAAVADVDEGRARRAQAKFGGRHVFSDYHDVLACPDVDVVVNLTRHKVHAEINLATLDAGKHLYTEKPMATTLEEADRIVEKAATAGVALAAAPAIVLDPQVAFTKQLYAEGRLGRMCFARVHGSHEGGTLHGHFYDAAWYHMRSEGGGPLFDTGVYALHTITGVLGPAKRVVAFSSLCMPERHVASVWQEGFQPYTISADVDDNVLIMLDWGDGTFGQVDASHCMLASQGPWAEFYGSKGVVVSGAGEAPRNEGEPPFQVYLEPLEFGRRGWFKPYPDRAAQPQRWHIGYGVPSFIDAIHAGEPPANSGEHARHVIEIIEKAVESAATGQICELTTTF
jgi:predicted dehydrogenase